MIRSVGSRCAALLLVVGLGVGFADPTVGQTPAERTRDPQTDSPTDLELTETVDVEGEAPEAPALLGVASRLGGVSGLPASLSTVGFPLLDDQNALSLSDALENVPGINVQTGGGTFDSFWIRGFESVSSALVLNDGAIEPESTRFQLYNIDRVEVLRGPAGFLYGGRALAGTVNLVRERPSGQSVGMLDVQGGGWGFLETTVDIDRAVSDALGVRVSGLYREGDGWRDRNSEESWAINPSMRWRGERTTVDASLEVARDRVEPDGGLPIAFDPFGGARLVDVPERRSYDRPSDISEQEIERFQVNVEHRRSDALSFRQKVYLSRLDWQSQGTILLGAVNVPLAGDLALRTSSNLDDVQTFYGTQAELAYTFETGAVEHRLQAGVELSRFEDDVQFGVSLLAPVSLQDGSGGVDQSLGTVPSQARFGDVTTDVIAPFVVDRIQLGDSLELTLGLRWDSFDIDGDGTISDRDDDQTSPLVGLAWTPNEDWTAWASWGQSFEPQSTLVLGPLVPEEGEQVEVGVRTRLGPLTASLTAYELEKTNLAIPDQTGFGQQTGDQTSRGIELELAGRLAPRLDARLAYAYTDAELTTFREIVVFGQGPTDFFVADRSGNRAAYAPEHLASLWLTYELGSGSGVGLGGRFVDEQPIAADNAFLLDDSFVLDATGFTTWRDLRFHVNLRNLGDETYFTRAFGTSAVVPAPGFHVVGGVRWVF